MAEPQNPTVAMRPGVDPSAATRAVVCPTCGKTLTAEPNFCPACGGDLRGLTGTSDTLSGPLKDKLIDGRYRLLEKLGEGGMGTVYKVEHVRMGKIAALKVLRPDNAVDKSLKGRFLQEAHVVAKLSHPNTVQVFDTGELEDGSLFIAMEFVGGKDLAWQLKAHGPVSEQRVIALAVQLLSSLQEAHEAGIVHRDIKPANVMVVRGRKGEERVKLLDFGIAKLQEAEGRKSTTGDFIGTPAYMSPEQIRGEAVDARSDLYSLGAMLFELVTGRQLFVGSTPISIITQHSEAPVPRVVEVAPSVLVSAGFEEVLRRALAKTVADRFKDADEMRAALEAISAGLKLTTRDFTPVPPELAEKVLSREDFDRYERRIRLSRVLAPVITVAVMVGAGVGAWRYVSTLPVDTVHAVEVEPNDTPQSATAIGLGVDVQGAIGAAPVDQSDRDLYVVDVADGPVRVTLSGVPDLNLSLELSQLERQGEADKSTEKLKRRLFLDDVGLGLAERADAVQLTAGKLYLRVQEGPFATEPNRPPREKSLVPYTLRVDPMKGGPLEVEPNDSASTAQPLPLTKSLTAFAGARIDDLEALSDLRPNAPFSAADWFRVDAPADEVVVVAVVPPERGALQVVDGALVDAWRAKKVKGPAPVGVLVKGEPMLVELKAVSGATTRRIRISAAEDTLPGAEYRVAPATSGENGLAGVLDLARALRDADQTGSRKALLQQAQKVFEKSPDLARLKEAL